MKRAESPSDDVERFPDQASFPDRRQVIRTAIRKAVCRKCGNGDSESELFLFGCHRPDFINLVGSNVNCRHGLSITLIKVIYRIRNHQLNEQVLALRTVKARDKNPIRVKEG